VIRTIKVDGVTALALGLLVWWVSACAATKDYTEPAWPENETAILEASVPVWIISLDGQRVSYDLNGDTKSIKVLPGDHVVQVSYSRVEEVPPPYSPPGSYLFTQRRTAHSNGYADLKFTAKPGHTYSISSGRAGNKWAPSIHDFFNLPAIQSR